MAETDKQPTGGSTPPQSRPTGRYLLLAAVLAVAGVALLYGMMAGGGKQSGEKLAAACMGAAATATRIAPLAHGGLAALAVAKTPKPATDIPFLGPDGKSLTLADFRGKTILLNIWATWCVPCRAEMPALDRLQRALGDEGFEVVAVNIDTSRLERRKPFLDSVGVKDLKFYTDEKADSFQILKQAGKVIGLPTTFLIGPNGCELGRMAGPAEWDSEQAKALIRAAVGK